MDNFQKECNFIHVGLFQVGANPLMRLGLNKPIYLSLRDARHLVFEDSILGIINRTWLKPPIYFNCYPNLCLDIKDGNLQNTLTLDIQTKNIIPRITQKNLVVL